MRPKKALVWLLLGFFLVGEANSAPFGRLRARLRSREQQRANPPAPAAGTPQASAQASSIGGGGITGGGGTPAGGGGASSVGALTDIDNADTATDGQVLTANGDDTFTFEEVVGGSGITYDGTVTDGQIPVYDDTANEYIPTQAGAPVYSGQKPDQLRPAWLAYCADGACGWLDARHDGDDQCCGYVDDGGGELGWGAWAWRARAGGGCGARVEFAGRGGGHSDDAKSSHDKYGFARHVHGDNFHRPPHVE
jgi:hypothetical protein